MVNNIVYVVTSGEYSDYSINAIFSTIEKAENYIAKGIEAGEFPNPIETNYDIAKIEEYKLDSEDDIAVLDVWHSSLRIDNGEIFSIPTKDKVLSKTFRGRTRQINSIILAESTVSEEHCLKIATEERQKILRQLAGEI